MSITSKQVKITLTSVGVLLSLVFVAMQVSDEVNWSVMDFIIMGTLLTTAGLSISYLWIKYADSQYRLAFIFLVLIAVFLIWAELAVGIL